MREKYDVVVVGGGLSGLVAARTLLQHDHNLTVAVLEANSRVGGRILTQKLQVNDKSISLDLGAHRVHSTQTQLLSLLDQLQVAYSGPSPAARGSSVVEARNRHFKCQGPGLNWLHQLQLQHVVYTAEQICSQISILDPYCNDNTRRFDSKTYSSWLRDNCWFQPVLHYLTVLCRAVFAADPDQLSALYVFLVAKSLGGFRSLFWSDHFTISGGTGEIINRLMDGMSNRIDVLPNTPVAAIQQSQSGIRIKTASGTDLLTERAVVCIPPTQQANIAWQPRLPILKEVATASIPMGRIIKFVLVFDRDYWTDCGMTGTIFSTGGGEQGACEGGPVTITFAESDGDSHFLTGIVGGKLAAQWSTKSPEILKAAILSKLEQLLGSWVGENQDLIVKDWSGEEFSFGVGYATPGSMYAWPAIRLPVKCVHFGGTETATAGLGFLEGAVQSGTRAALEVLRVLRPQTLTAEEEQILEEHDLANAAKSCQRHRAVFRWTIILPLSYILAMYAAMKLRNRYSSCLIPFH